MLYGAQLGSLFGKASAPRSWKAGLAYQIIEKEALFGQLIDSDFLGLTDSRAWIVHRAYAPAQNRTVNTTWFVTGRNVDVGASSDFDRLQPAFNVKF